MRPSNTTHLQASVLAQYGLLLHAKQHPLYLHSRLDLVPIPALTTLFLSTPVSYSSQYFLPTSNWVPFVRIRSTGTPEDFAYLSFQVGEAIVCCRCLLPGQIPNHASWLRLHPSPLAGPVGRRSFSPLLGSGLEAVAPLTSGDRPHGGGQEPAGTACNQAPLATWPTQPQASKRT